MIVRSKILELKPFVIKKGINMLGQHYVLYQEPLYRISLLVDFPDQDIMVLCHIRDCEDFFYDSDIFDLVPFYTRNEQEFMLFWSTDFIN